MLAARQSPAELARRARVMTRFANVEPATRRLGGSSAAFDRGFYRFVESARRTLPRGCAGVALDVPAAGPQHLYLASYVLAPLPVRLGGPVPPGWIVAVYGRRPAASGAVREIPGGALLLPDSAQRR